MKYFVPIAFVVIYGFLFLQRQGIVEVKSPGEIESGAIQLLTEQALLDRYETDCKRFMSGLNEDGGTKVGGTKEGTIEGAKEGTNEENCWESLENYLVQTYGGECEYTTDNLLSVVLHDDKSKREVYGCVE